MTIWQNLWSSFKEFIRKEKTFKSGAAPAKELDPTKKMLMEKMKYFEPFVVDVFSSVLTSSNSSKPTKATSSLWKVKPQVTQSTETARKVPPPNKHFIAREDRKERMFKLVEDLATKATNITEESQELIQKNKAVSSCTKPEDQCQKALLKIVDKYFVNLTPENRSLCLEEMLDAITGE